jgi:pimeloyl-ACP methyl ester carboxylesterase
MAGTWVQESRVDAGGSTLAVRQSGDPDGKPLVYFHGTPSSRRETAFTDPVSTELGIRMIAFDRPGYGDSPAAAFSLASIARATGALADHLGIGRFATTGQSGGGPFSLACASVLGDRVTRTGVTSGAGPFDQVPGLMATLDENDTKAVALLPDRTASAAQFGVGFEPLSSLGRASDAEIVAGFKQMSSRHDGDLLDRPEVASAVAAMMRISLAHGTSGGGWDNVAWVGPWDIDLTAIRQPVFLWYGDDDPFCPPSIAPWLDEHLPTATLVVREGEGHLGVMEHTREILETLVSD